MTRTVNANSVKIVAEDSEEGILLSVSQDGKLATNKIDNQGNVDNQASALTSDFISLTDTPGAFQAEKYLKVNVIESLLKELWRQYYNPDMWSLGEKLDKWILLYQMGKKDKIRFKWSD